MRTHQKNWLKSDKKLIDLITVLQSFKDLGQAGSRERITADEVIGYYSDGETLVPTNTFIIHYANDGVHIVPVRPQ